MLVRRDTVLVRRDTGKVASDSRDMARGAAAWGRQIQGGKEGGEKEFGRNQADVEGGY